ncbi:GNAT family N-acetyltransferase [Herpetosiphon geysericola]|uniref:N-acetyltransferase domain-containing protein n=1 Tax=Herpetosiphon geysericola TaxID=70996 RepID=A0A0P6YA13_9CHLR|nr:GNAT family N-acetyltransferase [Herpetosiphon geysericola]KPL86086.1 hypothetical protein SE18_14525 [Herpetosiphon geysericola]
MLDPEVFSTQRLVASKIGLEHIDLIAAMHQNPTMMATLGGLQDRQRTQQGLETQVQDWQQAGYGLCVFHDRASGAFVGRGGLRLVQLDNQPETEIAYALLPEWWGQGLATEIARQARAVAFAQLQLDSLVLFTMTTNYASQRVAEKLGMVYERNFERANLPHVLFRQTRQAWANLG